MDDGGGAKMGAWGGGERMGRGDGARIGQERKGSNALQVPPSSCCHPATLMRRRRERES